MRRTRRHKHIQSVLVYSIICVIVVNCEDSAVEGTQQKSNETTRNADERSMGSQQFLSPQKHLNDTKHNATKDTLMHYALHKASLEHGKNMAKMAQQARLDASTTTKPEPNTSKVEEDVTSHGHMHFSIHKAALEHGQKMAKMHHGAFNGSVVETNSTKEENNATVNGVSETGSTIATNDGKGNVTEKCTPPAIRQVCIYF